MIIEPNSKLTDWKKEPSIEDLRHDINNAENSHRQQIGKIDNWLDILHKESDKSLINQGRSGFQVKLSKRLAERRYASLGGAILKLENVFKVDAKNPKSLHSAIKNELVLNYQFNVQLNKVKFVNDLVRTLVNEGTAIIRIGWDNETIKVKEKVQLYVQPDPNELQYLLQAIQIVGQEKSEKNLQSFEEADSYKQLPEELQANLRASIEQGTPVIVQDTNQTQEVEKVTKNQPALEVIPNKSLIIDPSCNGNFDNAKFCVYRYSSSYAELKATGLYKDIDKYFKVTIT